MASSKDLHELIHSLTPSEKRYVRRFAAISGRQAAWVKLFDAIEKVDSYNEDAIRARLVGESMLNNLSVAKRYVYQNVLRALRLYGTGRDNDSELSDAAENYKILLSKGLHRQSAATLKQLRVKAHESDAYLKVLWSIICEFSAGVHSTKEAAIDHLDWFLGKQRETLDAIENYSFFGGIYFRQRIILRHRQHARTPEDRALLTHIVTPLLQPSEPIYLSNTAFTFAQLTLGDYWEAMGEPLKAKQYFDRLLTDGVLDLHVSAFDSLNLARLTNAVFFRLRHGFVEGMDVLIHELRTKVGTISLKLPMATEQLWYYERWLTFSVMYYNATAREHEAQRLIQSHETLVKQRPVLFTRKIQLQLEVASIRTCFGLGHFQRAIAIAHNIIEREDPNLVEVHMAHLALLIALYELQRFDELDVRLRRAKYHFTTQHHFHTCEQAVLKGLKQLMQSTSDRHTLRIRTELHTTLAAVLEHPAERQILGVVDVLRWCKPMKHETT